MLSGKKLLLAGLIASATCISQTASATELNFSYVSAFVPLQVTADWRQSSAPIPLSFLLGNSTTVAAAGHDAALLFGLTPVISGTITQVIFNSAPAGGGFSGADFAVDTGPQVYLGSETAPVFSVGVFALDNGTLTVTAVPEPASWTLMLAGFGAIGFAARGRRNVRVIYA